MPVSYTHLNPTNCLEALEKDREKLSGLPMPARYRTWKEIDLLFRDLYDDRLLGQYHEDVYKRQGDVPKFQYDLTKIHKWGWYPSHTSNEAVEATLEHVL